MQQTISLQFFFNSFEFGGITKHLMTSTSMFEGLVEAKLTVSLGASHQVIMKSTF